MLLYSSLGLISFPLVLFCSRCSRRLRYQGYWSIHGMPQGEHQLKKSTLMPRFAPIQDTTLALKYVHFLEKGFQAVWESQCKRYSRNKREETLLLSSWNLDSFGPQYSYLATSSGDQIQSSIYYIRRSVLCCHPRTLCTHYSTAPMASHLSSYRHHKLFCGSARTFA